MVCKIQPRWKIPCRWVSRWECVHLRCANGNSNSVGLRGVTCGILAYFAVCSVLRNLLAEKGLIGAVSFSRDGKYLATGSWDGGLYVSLFSKHCHSAVNLVLQIWGISTKHVRNAFKGHTRYIQSLEFSPNGRSLVSASYDNTVRLWNLRDASSKVLTEDDPTSLLSFRCFQS
jgi:WD40 repeat protein